MEQIFKIIVYSHALDPDENESFVLSDFETYDDALQKAMTMVQEDLTKFYEPGMSIQDLLEQFKMLGNVPVIEPEPDPDNPFLAWVFAESTARELSNPV